MTEIHRKYIVYVLFSYKGANECLNPHKHPKCNLLNAPVKYCQEPYWYIASEVY